MESERELIVKERGKRKKKKKEKKEDRGGLPRIGDGDFNPIHMGGVFGCGPTSHHNYIYYVIAHTHVTH